MSVFIAKENKHTKQAIRRIITHFKNKLDLSRGIFLKPNIVFPVKEKSGEITRHKVVRGLIEVLREINVGNDDFTISGEDAEKLGCNRDYQPREHKNFLRLRLWSNPRACSMCRFVFLNLKRFSKHNFIYSTIMKLKLMKYAVTGAEIVFGSKSHLKREYNQVICIGNCTEKLSKEKGYLHVPGCPPTKDDMLRYL